MHRGLKHFCQIETSKSTILTLLRQKKDIATGTAVAAHAEGMRLERIRVIADDESAPVDIRDTFTKILKDEVWHEKAFTNLSTPDALGATMGDYKLGREALGLTA